MTSQTKVHPHSEARKFYSLVYVYTHTRTQRLDARMRSTYTWTNEWNFASEWGRTLVCDIMCIRFISLVYFHIIAWLTFINAHNSLDNLIGQNVITWGCINGWYRLAYQNQSSVFVPAVLIMWRAVKTGITCLIHVLRKCFVCPQNVKYIWLYSTTNTFCLYFENEINTSIYELEKTVWCFGLYNMLMTGFVHGHWR